MNDCSLHCTAFSMRRHENEVDFLSEHTYNFSNSEYKSQDEE